MRDMGKCLDKKRVSDCMIALSSYLAEMLSVNESVLEDSVNKIKECIDRDKIEQYIN